MMKNKSLLFSALIYLFLSILVYAQKGDVISLSVDPNFDIREAAKEYLGNADLWPYIVKHNNYKSLSEIKPGTALLIPQKKVKNLFEKIEFANKSIQEAVLIGAKVLAEENLANAESSIKDALKQRSEFEYDEADKSAIDAIAFAKKAYQQTKDIREKTIEAIISFKKGTVQKMFPSVFKWQNAEIYENLKENDWARTLSLSMANITFQDLSQLKLNENSQAIIQSSRFDLLNNKTFTKVKLEKGDAYAILLNTPKKKFDLDIKGIKTKINSKYFWVEKTNSNSKIANYNGEIKIEAQDSAVVVAKNQGSVIPDGGLPSKPKNLLPPPQIVNPAMLQIFKNSSVTFEWKDVQGAESYWLEIAFDPSYKKTFQMKKNIKGLTVQVNGFEGGVYYWHVCSVDNLDLPGPYTESRAFVISIDKSKPFLSVETPEYNYVTKENKLIVKGKTNPGCTVTANQNNLSTGIDGYFSGELTLAEGINRIEIQSVNSAGIKNSTTRNVYYESDLPILILEDKVGELNETTNLITNKNYLPLNISTRALAKIEVQSIYREWKRIGYADSLGKCTITLNLAGESEEMLMSVSTPAGYSKKIKLIVKKDFTPPVITLKQPEQNTVNADKILVAGSINEKAEISINGFKVVPDAQNNFSLTLSLKRGENNIEIKTSDPAGNSYLLLSRIFLDDEAPVLVSNETVELDQKKNFYKVLVKAADATALKKTAEVEIQTVNGTRKELLELNSSGKVYEGIFNFGMQSKPVIKKITLEDYLSNKKSYQVN
jgi:hypothetical protein